MKPKKIEAIDFKKVDNLLEGFNKTTGFVTAILDLEGTILSKSGWRRMCTHFHRVNPETAQKCAFSDTVLANKMAEGEKYHFYKCPNGLVDVAVPIIIDGEHIANLFSGQFFFEKPDFNFFRQQAQRYGFDEKEYIEALEKVPVVSEEDVKTAMNFLLDMTELISDLAFQKLEQAHQQQLIADMGKVAKIGGWEFDAQTGKGTWTAETARIHDLDPNDETNIEKGISFYKPKSRERIEQAITEAITTGRPYQLELELVTATGAEKWVQTIGHPLLENGKVVKVRGSFQDITEKRQAEMESLRLAEELIDVGNRAKALLESIPDFIFVFNQEGYFIDYHSPDDHKLLMPPSFFMNKHVEQVLPEPIANLTIEAIHRLFSENKPQTYQYQVQKDGKTWHYDARMVKYGTNMAYAIVRDITTQQENEIKIEEQERQLASLIGHLPGFVYRCLNDEAWSMLFISDKCLQITGYTPNEFVTDRTIDFKKLIPFEYHKETEQKWAESLQNKTRFEFRYPIKTKSGEMRWVWERGEGVFDSKGNLLFLEGYIEDITELKQTEIKLIAAKERAEESDRLKSAFLANMSHEIRTPMNSIMGFASLLPEEDSKELMFQYAKIIVRNSEQLIHIIDDIVLYSRLQAKILNLNARIFKVCDLLEDLLLSFNLPEYTEKVKLTSEMNIDCSYQIQTDYEKLRQIFMNLISNAYKYTHKGSITIGCEMKDNQPVFFVKDTGIGIPKGESHKVFERFFRGSNTYKESVPGTGLGLSIVKELIDLIGGKIWVESEEEKGSTFWFYAG